METIFLRALSMDDLDVVYKWHSNEDLYKTLVGPYRYVSKDAEREWLQNKVKYLNQEINLLICLSETSQPIGMVSVREIDWTARHGYLSGIFIGELNLRGRGYGLEALSLVVKHCFMNLGLNRIYAQILKDNYASLKIFQECGFIKEGLLRQHAIKEGQSRDVVIVGLCADQYKENYNS